MLPSFLAFDIGAESGRAIAASLGDGRLRLDEVHRFANTPVTAGGSLHWDMPALQREIAHALSRLTAPITSLGIDTWGCDYALVGADGALLEPPFHYRDRRTDGVMDRVLTRIGRDRIYDITGIQFLPFNTIFQLVAASEQQPAVLDRAAALLTIPDYLNSWLTGRACCELTNATTTQCVDARTRDWSTPLIESAGLPRRLFGPIVEPGTHLGALLADRGGPAGTPVVAPACHDTGSAVAAIRAGGDVAFLSSGTWSLVGIEVAAPIITTRTAALNLTNEGGVAGTTRLLKNVAGLWLLQACRRDWHAEGRTFSYDQLADAAAAAAPQGATIDPDAAVFLNPANMPAAIVDFCRRTGQQPPETVGAFARTIFESLALKYRLVIEWLEEVSGLSIRTVRVIGGGARNALLNQLTADVTGRTVVAGPVEATALGNVAMQMLATGHVSTLDEARDIIHRSFPAGRFDPAGTDRWDRPYRRFRDHVDLART